MADVLVNQDFKGVARVVNLPQPVAPQEPATKSYVDANAGGLSTGKVYAVTGRVFIN